VSIEDEDNVMLANYAKNIGHAMKGIRVSIFEKWHCKNNYNTRKIVSNGFIQHCVPCQTVFFVSPHPPSPCEKDGWGFFWNFFVCNTFI
jgi:hypothetical protein